jgi:hypothetical protein
VYNVKYQRPTILHRVDAQLQRAFEEGTMIDRPDADPRPGNLPETQVRKPWHAPLFIVTDVAATDTVGNANSDGGPMGTAS